MDQGARFGPLRLRPPPLPSGLVDRQRLSDLILATEPGGVCILSSAPGYGATTAMSMALRSGADGSAWVALNHQTPDDEARRLVFEAVRNMVPGSSGAEPAALADHVEAAGPMWLAVDDLDPHRHPGALRDLADLARHLPAHARLLIGSHADLPAVALASGGRAVMLDEAELRFEADEAVELIQSIAPGVDIELTAPIVQAAEGWAAALVIAATHARRHDDAGWLARSGADVLLRDWFGDLPVEVRDLLAATAVLDFLTADVVAAVTGRSDAGEALLDLAARHCFVTEVEPPAGHRGRWWCRHPLLSGFLQQRRDPRWPERHSLAAEWYQQTGDVDRTMHHLLSAGRTRDAGRYLTDHESEMFGLGRAEQMLEWYDRLPTEWGPRTTHLLRIGWGQTLSGDRRGADATLHRLEAELGAPGRNSGRDGTDTDTEAGATVVRAETALLRAYLASFRADPATMMSAGRVAMAGLAGHPPSDSQQLAPLLVTRGLLWSGQPEAAQRMLDRVGDQPYPTAVLRESRLPGTRALVAAANGSIRQANVWADEALDWLRRQGLDPLTVGQYAPVLASGTVQLQAGQLAAAHATAAQVAAAAEHNGQLGDAVAAWLLLADVEAAGGDLGAALRTLAQAREVATTATPGTSIVVPLDHLQARVRLAAGDVLRAERVIRTLPQGDAALLLLVRVGLVHQPAVARRTLEALQPATPVNRAERHLLLALSFLRTSRRMAQGHLSKAASIAQQHGMGTLLANADPGILGLARDTAVQGPDDAVAWLLDRRATARETEGGSHAPPSGAPVLSRGELQLLSLLPSRASNADIAAALGVSVNTIKTRLRRLYAKLDAANRDAALRRARELGLGPASR